MGTPGSPPSVSVALSQANGFTTTPIEVHQVPQNVQQQAIPIIVNQQQLQQLRAQQQQQNL